MGPAPEGNIDLSPLYETQCNSWAPTLTDCRSLRRLINFDLFGNSFWRSPAFWLSRLAVRERAFLYWALSRHSFRGYMDVQIHDLPSIYAWISTFLRSVIAIGVRKEPQKMRIWLTSCYAFR